MLFLAMLYIFMIRNSFKLVDHLRNYNKLLLEEQVCLGIWAREAEGRPRLFDQGAEIDMS